MPWIAAARNLGFSTSEPWLPIGDTHAALAVDVQERSGDSVLAFTRACFALRRSSAALRKGSMKIIEAGDEVLVFERAADDQRLRCSFNLSDRAVPFAPAGKELIRSGHVDTASIGPYAALIEEIK